MSLVFNDTVTLKGIVQIYEKECGLKRGTVSSDTNRLKELAAEVNLAFDDFLSIGFQASGTWNLDDSNHTDYPIITTDLIGGQRSYSFLEDESGNLILDIFKVLAKDSNGTYQELDPVDVQSQRDTTNFTDGKNLTGQPKRYDKTANGFFFDLIPPTTIEDGLKVYINREPSYFTYTDTTKKPGVPGNLHRYFAIKPASDYARQKRLANKNDLLREVALFEAKIGEAFATRPRDERKRLIAGRSSTK